MKLRYLVVLILVLAVLSLSGCLDSNDNVNPDSKTVYSITDGINTATITLYPDHTFTAIYPKSGSGGTYRIDGDQLILTYQGFGIVHIYKISGDTLIDEKNGYVWKRVK